MPKSTVLATEDDLSVDLTLHDFTLNLLTEFAEKIVKPYYSGNINNAVRDLLQKAISEEQLVRDHAKSSKPTTKLKKYENGG